MGLDDSPDNGVGEGDGDGLGVGDGVGVDVAVGDGLGVAVGDGVGVAVGVGVGVGLVCPVMVAPPNKSVSATKKNSSVRSIMCDSLRVFGEVDARVRKRDGRAPLSLGVLQKTRDIGALC